MKPIASLPSPVLATFAAVEKMIRDCQNCRDMLQAELTLLRVKERILKATEDTGWLVRQYIAPREAELATLDEKVEVLRERMAELRRHCFDTTPTPTVIWMETNSPEILALSA